MSRRPALAVDNLSWVVKAFSDSRIRPYLSAVEGDLTGATYLYGVNLRASLELFGWLSVLEVVLRNALVRTISNCDDNFEPLYAIWQDLAPEGKARYQWAAKQVRMHGKRVNTNTISAELPFSFWKHLLSSKYQTTLWVTHFRHAFPHLKPQNRAVVFEAVEAAVELRNRIAHHEPIFRRELGTDLARILQIIG